MFHLEYRSFIIVVTAALTGAAPASGLEERIDKVEVVGTAFRVGLTSGRLLEGRALEGATLLLVMPGGVDPQPMRLDEIRPDPDDPDGDVLLYRISVVDRAAGAREELCEPDAEGATWAFPLQGQWDAEGRHVSDKGFTMTCASGAQGKCVRFGYKPWKILPDGTRLADYHQACVHLVRADYCGGRGTTRDGVLIDIYDRIGIQRPVDDPGRTGIRFEAAWNTDGAVCVAHTRVPANMPLEQLGETCPRLIGHLGVACTEAEASSGRLGSVLLFNRSR